MRRDTLKKERLFFLAICLFFLNLPLSAGAQEEQKEPTTICILDSGCDESDAEGKNYLNEQEGLQDTQGHGTLVYQILKEAVPDAELLMLKCLYGEADTGKEKQAEKSAEEAAVIQALYEAIDVYEADLINISWTRNAESEALHEAVRYAYEQGCMIVAAAGNLSLATPLGSMVYPAGWDEVIGVGGVDLDEAGRPVSSLWYLQNEAIFVCTDGNYQGEKGTSFAVPRVTALIAEYLQSAEANKKTDRDVRQYLKTIAEDLGEEGYDPVYGWGYVRRD